MCFHARRQYITLVAISTTTLRIGLGVLQILGKGMFRTLLPPFPDELVSRSNEQAVMDTAGGVGTCRFWWPRPEKPCMPRAARRPTIARGRHLSRQQG